jgi:uncharacterized membrane protein YhaH (DUF805 family)
MQQPQAAMMGAAHPGMNVVQGSRPTKMMSPIDAVTSGMKGSTSFDGRASRSEFWWFFLFYMIVNQILGTIAVAMDQPALIYAIILLVPAYISVAARRMHDHGKSGWFMLIPIYNLVLFATDGEVMPNAHGPVPTNEP